MDESWRYLPMTLGVRRTPASLTDSVVRDITPMSSTGLPPAGGGVAMLCSLSVNKGLWTQRQAAAYLGVSQRYLSLRAVSGQQELRAGRGPLPLPFPIFMMMDIYTVLIRRINQNRLPPNLELGLEKIRFESTITNNYLKAFMLLIFSFIAGMLASQMRR
jgi:hypothetical protein